MRNAGQALSLCMQLASENIKTVDFEPIESTESSKGKDTPLIFRLEIHKYIKNNLYFGKVFKQDLYRLQPTFYPEASHSDDVLIYVIDHTFESEELLGDSPKAIIKIFKKVVQEKLGV